MPNWCSNNISIKTTDEQSRKLMKDYEKYYESVSQSNPPQKIHFLNWFHPIPELEEGGWYNWCISHWGTKRDPDISGLIVEFRDIGNDDIELTLSPDSAWSPPIDFYHYMETLGFSVNASWYEPGVGSIGEFSEGYADDSYLSEPTGALRILYDYYNGNYEEINVDIDPRTLNAGDLINDEFLLISSREISWDEICDGQYDCLDNRLHRQHDSALDEACGYGMPVIEVVFAKSMKEPGEITGLYIDNKIVYSWVG